MDSTLFPEGQCRLILVGKSGNGKSSTGNTILGFRAFQAQVGINSMTQFGDLQSRQYGDIELQVMDTPGLQDTEVSEQEIATRITRSLLAVSPGPHAILLCLSCDQRFSNQEMKIFETLKDLFGDLMTSYVIVVMVKRDVLDERGVRFEDQLKNCEELKNLLRQVNNRYILFDNRTELSQKKKNDQVDSLLRKVAEVVSKNRGNCFRHKLSVDLDSSMDILKQEELRRLEHNPTICEEVLKPPKPTREMTSKADAKDSRKIQKEMTKSVIHLKESRLVSVNRKIFEPTAPKPQLTPEEITSKLTLKSHREPNQKRRQAPTVGKTLEANGRSVQRQIEVACTSNPHQDHVRPPKPRRISWAETAEDPEKKTGRGLTQHSDIQGQETTPAQMAQGGFDPSESFTYKVPDRPLMMMKDKQSMVETALKRKLAQGKDLTDDQIEELEKTSRSLGQKLRDGMKKIAVTTVDMCRLM